MIFCLLDKPVLAYEDACLDSDLFEDHYEQDDCKQGDWCWPLANVERKGKEAEASLGKGC